MLTQLPQALEDGKAEEMGGGKKVPSPPKKYSCLVAFSCIFEDGESGYCKKRISMNEKIAKRETLACS